MTDLVYHEKVENLFVTYLVFLTGLNGSSHNPYGSDGNGGKTRNRNPFNRTHTPKEQDTSLLTLKRTTLAYLRREQRPMWVVSEDDRDSWEGSLEKAGERSRFGH